MVASAHVRDIYAILHDVYLMRAAPRLRDGSDNPCQPLPDGPAHSQMPISSSQSQCPQVPGELCLTREAFGTMLIYARASGDDFLSCGNAGFNEFSGLTEPQRCRIVARAADAHRLNQAFSETPFDGLKFNPITEHQVSPSILT